MRALPTLFLSGLLVACGGEPEPEPEPAESAAAAASPSPAEGGGDAADPEPEPRSTRTDGAHPAPAADVAEALGRQVGVNVLVDPALDRELTVEELEAIDAESGWQRAAQRLAAVLGGRLEAQAAGTYLIVPE